MKIGSRVKIINTIGDCNHKKGVIKENEIAYYVIELDDGKIINIPDPEHQLIETNSRHGGKRKGAGRKKSEPTVVYQLNINKQLRNELKAKYTAKEINAKIRELLITLNCV